LDFLISDFGLNPQSALRSKMHFTMHRLGGFGFYTLIGNGPESVSGDVPRRSVNGQCGKGREVRGMQLGHGATYAISNEQGARKKALDNRQ
jgi:hypothetical protein